MQHIFINSSAIVRPAFFTKYYHASGESYQRIEGEISNASFQKDAEAVRVELYKNSTSNMIKPVLMKVIYRQE